MEHNPLTFTHAQALLLSYLPYLGLSTYLISGICKYLYGMVVNVGEHRQWNGYSGHAVDGDILLQFF